MAILSDALTRSAWDVSADKPSLIHTDYLNAITYLSDSLQICALPYMDNKIPGRSYYLWLESILARVPAVPKIIHVKAHTGGSSTQGFPSIKSSRFSPFLN